MKYIRTKDGLHETKELTKCEDARFPNGWFNKNGAPIVAIKQANYIEDLCDEFDLKWTNEEYPYSTIRQHERYGGFGDLKRAIRDKQVYGYQLNKDYKVYGGIWTDKGFDYVAKMNDDEDLELLNGKID